MGSENNSNVTSTAATSAGRWKRGRPVETIKVRVVPLATPEATEAAIGHLVEEWAALTYSCLLEAAMAMPTANEPMHPDDAATAGAADVRVG